MATKNCQGSWFSLRKGAGNAVTWSHGEKRRNLVEFAKGWGEIAAELQHALLIGFCEATTRQQAGRLPETLPCPDCGRECPLKPPDGMKTSRSMTLRGGGFQLAELCCYCSGCRYLFLPRAGTSSS